MKSFVNLEDGSNLSQISPILTCINTLNESSILWDDDRSKHFKSISLEKFKNEIKISKEDGFCFAVSLRDGSCIYTSDAVSYHLGYPKDMLVGQCIMNFLFHKDHITFANHLTQGLNACFIQGKRDDSHLVLNTFFCRLRLYQGLKQGYSVSDRNTEYKPFKIILHINELIVDDMCVEKPSGTLCVKATATHVASAYSVPEEIPAMTSFSTRHTASCHFSHVDASAIPYLGYLPQDMIGYSVFDFYHVDDLPQLKDIYELVIKEHGSSFRSKPYRFKAQNGCYIMLETEWSCFINPWSHKLEFVVGQHRVLKGPSEIDIFTPSQIYDIILPDEILKECQNIQREIKSLLSESIQTFEAKKTKRFCNKRKRDLAAFVYNCIDDLKGNKQKGNDAPLDMLEDKNNSDPDSVVMGDISPYREANDSSVTSETPPSVQQLRYQENIERFFASQPKTYSDGSNEYNKNEKLLSVEDSQGSSSGSRNGSGSGNDSNSKGVQSQNDNNNQKSGSNSSKCNMSSFTTGDSGYGKSVEKETNDHSVSQTGSSNQIWTNNSPKDCVTNNMEKFSSCLALTEESLCVHNRMNHKHFKQQRKSKPGVATVPLKENWFQKDTTLPKHKKHVHTQTLTLSAPNQKEDALKATATEQPALDFQPSSEQKGTAPNLNDSAVPSAYASNPYMFPNNWSPSPTPFFIPVMYMGGMTFFPPATNAQPQWPFGPVPPQTTTTSVSSTPKEGNAGCFQIPSFSPLSFQKFNLGENFNQTSTPSKGHTSGISTTLSTTTATHSVETVTSHKHPMTESPNYSGRNVILTNKDKNLKPDPDDCQMHESQSSSFTNSSSCRSADKDEDMELESKRCCASTHSDKIELTSELAYRYQMNVLNLDDVLKKDMEVLKSMPQPELVNQQLQMLQDEREAENESKLKVDEDDFCMTEDVMLGLATEDDVNEELEYREESLLQLMCEDS